MAVFSVFHLWAFPWSVYDIQRSQIVASESVPGQFLDPKTAYQGGFLGIKALMDAFNPWDLVKAVGRGFKWFAVGRRTREQDISYKSSTKGTGLEPTRTAVPFQDPYHGNAPYDHNDFSADPDDSMHPYAHGHPSRYHPLDDEEEDNLLSHAQPVPQSPVYSHSHSRSHDLRQPDRKSHIATSDIGMMNLYSEAPNHREVTNAASGRNPPEFETQDTEYHGARHVPVPPPRSGHKAPAPQSDRHPNDHMDEPQPALDNQMPWSQPPSGDHTPQSQWPSGDHEGEEKAHGTKYMENRNRDADLELKSGAGPVVKEAKDNH